MRQWICFTLLLSLLLCCSAAASATTSEFVRIQYPSDFSINQIIPREGGTFLLAGAIAGLTDQAPAIIEIEKDGDVLWSIKQDNSDLPAFYRDARYFIDNTIIALRSVPDNPDCWIIEHIEQGEITEQIEITEYVLSVWPASDGFFVLSKPDAETAVIRKMSFDGPVDWQIDLDQQAMILGIISKGDVHVAYGYIIAMDAEYGPCSKGVVLAFDDRGDILWHHESAGAEKFISGIWPDQRGVVLIGNASPNEESDMIHPSFICEYNENGVAWRTDYDYPSTKKGELPGLAQRLIQVPNGWLVVSSAPANDMEAVFSYFDDEGNLKNQWAEPLEGFYARDIFSLNALDGKVFFLASGKGMPDALSQDQDIDFDRLPDVAVMKEIVLP